MEVILKKCENSIDKVGWLFWVYRLFETLFQSISDRLKVKGNDRRENKCLNNPLPHLLQAK